MSLLWISPCQILRLLLHIDYRSSIQVHVEKHQYQVHLRHLKCPRVSGWSFKLPHRRALSALPHPDTSADVSDTLWLLIWHLHVDNLIHLLHCCWIMGTTMISINATSNIYGWMCLCQKQSVEGVVGGTCWQPSTHVGHGKDREITCLWLSWAKETHLGKINLLSVNINV